MRLMGKEVLRGLHFSAQEWTQDRESGQEGTGWGKGKIKQERESQDSCRRGSNFRKRGSSLKRS